MAKANAPKSVKRNGSNFTANWNPGSNYQDQEIQWYLKKGDSWVEAAKYNIGKSVDNYPYKGVDYKDYYPGTNNNPKTQQLHVVGAKVRYKKDNKWSDWSDRTTFDILEPEPVKSVHSQQGSINEEYEWSWDPASSNTSDTTAHWRTYYYWETVLAGSGENPDWSKAQTERLTRINGDGETVDNAPAYRKYGSGTKVTIRENQSDIDARKVRHFRVRCAGPEGHSEYKSTSRPLGKADTVDGKQNQEGTDPGDVHYDGVNDNGTSSGKIYIPKNKVVEGDQYQVQYAFVEPYVTVTTEGNTVKSELSLPNAFDSWQDGGTINPTNVEGQYIPFTLQSHAADNQMLFMRVNSIRNNLTNYGVPFMLENGKGSLSRPTLSSFSASEPGDPQEITVTVTNNSPLGGGNGTFVAVYCRTTSNPNSETPIGIIPYTSGETTRTFPASWGDGETVTVGVRAFVADYSPATPSQSGVTFYSISNIKMESPSDWDQTTTSTLPKAPAWVTVTKDANDTTVLVEWPWTWTDANTAEISWSTNPNAWDSNNDPSSYTVTNTRVGRRYITDLSADTYWFRVRLIKNDGNVTTYGPYSDAIKKKISSAPNKPTLIISKSPLVVAMGEEITATWAYESTDGTSQATAMFAEVTQPTQDGPYSYSPFNGIQTGSAKKYTFTPETFGWTNGTSHMLAVRTKSNSGEFSEWSNPVIITVTPTPVLTIAGIGGQSDALRPLTVSEDLSFSLALVKLPLTFTVSGMGTGGQANVLITRATDYPKLDPSDDTEMAFAGETIFSGSFILADSGSDTVTVSISTDDLLGKFDHFANYILYISILDTYGQSVEADPYEFTVYWQRFSFEPDAEISILEDGSVLIKPTSFSEVSENSIAIVNGDLIFTYPDDDEPNPDPDYLLINGDLHQKESAIYDSYIENGDLYVTADSSVPAGDYCKIYRLSADKPQLIKDHAEFGETYIDEHPTYGRFGGYRIVYISKYGDYVTNNNMAAWTDFSVPINKFFVTIEFGDNVLEFPGNISLSHSWQKDFQLTKYLGGAVEGDWNPGVERTGTINGTIPIEYETEAAYLLRKLADYSDVCHVRTPDGSNFYADIQVQDDREEKWVNRLSQISLSYTRVSNRTDELRLYSELTEE